MQVLANAVLLDGADFEDFALEAFAFGDIAQDADGFVFSSADEAEFDIVKRRGHREFEFNRLKLAVLDG